MDPLEFGVGYAVRDEDRIVILGSQLRFEEPRNPKGCAGYDLLGQGDLTQIDDARNKGWSNA